MEPVAIARITDQGKFLVDNDKLVEIFGPLKDKDLSIISVAGSYRTGKSFMLNFFIRYLCQRGWENTHWLGSDDKKLQDGFDWKRGSHAHTQGINVWPEIFEVPSENGKMVSVMIVDTQGLFDNDNTPDTNAKILSISTLLCSHQILNIQNRLDERDLEHLQLSVEYACAAVGLFRERDGRGKQRTTFQKLTFLIRDWVNNDEYPYGNGGDEYMDKILRVKSKSKTVNDVKESVHRAFDEVKGFLMPHPGQKVCAGDQSTLSNADIEPIFREYTMQLTEATLHPRNLIMKQMFGKPISASALMNLLATVSNSFRDGKLPEIGTMLENTVRANNDEAVQRAVRRYKEVMTELVHREIYTPDVLREFHDNAVGEATLTFYEISTLGEENDKDKAHQHAIKECEDYYRIVEQENETRKSKVIEEINNLSSAMETQYMETMRDYQMDILGINQVASDVFSKFQQAFSRCGDEYCLDIESLQKTEYEKCLEQYDAQTAKYDDYATVKNTREKLSRNMEQHFTDHVKRVNENNKITSDGI
uniref:atlastin-3-like n=1 Tax=Styela clava TaxID=7725 RepID=UPI001939DE1B|nr:atlastin-3-like [Styela clava]